VDNQAYTRSSVRLSHSTAHAPTVQGVGPSFCVGLDKYHCAKCGSADGYVATTRALVARALQAKYRISPVESKE